MMAALFLIFLGCLGLILTMHKKAAFILAIANLIFIFFMLLQHATDALNIRL